MTRIGCLLLLMFGCGLNAISQGHSGGPGTPPTATITPTPSATPTPLSISCDSPELLFAYAQVATGGGDPTKARPATAQRMRQECMEYIRQGGTLGSVVDNYNAKRAMVAEKLSQWEALAESRNLNNVAPIEGIQQSHPFWMGQGLTDVVSQQAADVPKLLGLDTFWDCWDIGIHGVCIDIDISWSGIDIDIDLMRSYFWPVQLNEGVRHRGFSAYIQSDISRRHVRTGDDLMASNARSLARGNSRIAQMAYNSTANGLSAVTNLRPVEVRSPAEIPQSVVDAARSGPYADLDLRAFNPGAPGVQQTENRVLRNAVFSTITSVIRRLPLVNIFGPCHREKSTLGSQVLPAMSEGPVLALFSRGLQNNMVFPGMVQKTNLPLGTIGCMFYDMQQGDPRLRTPRDMVFPAGAMLPSLPGAVTANCTTGSQGNVYALITNANSNDGRTATEKSMLQGLELTSYMVRRGLFRQFYYEYVRERDKVQWTNDAPMVAEKGPECTPFSKDTLSYARDFSLADSDEDLQASDAPWNVNYVWRKFECCNSWNSSTGDGDCYGNCPDEELIS